MLSVLFLYMVLNFIPQYLRFPIRLFLYLAQAYFILAAVAIKRTANEALINRMFIFLFHFDHLTALFANYLRLQTFFAVKLRNGKEKNGERVVPYSEKTRSDFILAIFAAFDLAVTFNRRIRKVDSSDKLPTGAFDSHVAAFLYMSR